jgi:dihydrofolate reductase
MPGLHLAVITEIYERFIRIALLCHLDHLLFDVFIERQKIRTFENQENKMRKIIVSEGVSLDGVFDAQTMGQWARPFFSDERNEFVRQGVLAADALLYGRTTYDLETYYWPNQKDDKYGMADRMNRLPKYIVTSRPLQSQWNNSTVIKGDVLKEIARLKQQPGKDILVKGSAMLVQALLQAGLIDEFKFMLHPVIAGSGKRFFHDGMDMTKLKLVESKPISLGVLLLSYEPVK